MNYCIRNELGFTWGRFVTGNELQLFMVEEPNCNTLSIFFKYFWFLLLQNCRYIQLDVRGDPLVSNLSELFGGSAFRDVPYFLRQLDCRLAVELEALQFAIVGSQ